MPKRKGRKDSMQQKAKFLQNEDITATFSIQVPEPLYK